MRYVDEFVIMIVGIVVGLIVGMIAYGFGKEAQAQLMTDRCRTTGMYLTEGYAISCRVLTNEGYAPMIEQQKGK